MINRRLVTVDHNYTVALTTEEMRDGGWAVVVTVMQSTDGADLHVDLPVRHHRFGTEADAEQYGLNTAREWIDRNTPRVA